MIFDTLRAVTDVAGGVVDVATDVASEAVEASTFGLITKDKARNLLQAGYSVAEVAAIANLGVDVVQAIADE